MDRLTAIGLIFALAAFAYTNGQGKGKGKGAAGVIPPVHHFICDDFDYPTECDLNDDLEPECTCEDGSEAKYIVQTDRWVCNNTQHPLTCNAG